MRKARVRVPACEGVMREGAPNWGPGIGTNAEWSEKAATYFSPEQEGGRRKRGSDEKNKEQFEKKSPCFCFPIRKIEK